MPEQTSTYVLAPSKARPTTPSEIVDFLLNQAIKLAASDIHLGLTQVPGSSAPACLLRFRVNGKLQAMRSDYLNPGLKEVVARFKVLMGVNTAEIGVPQDGQVSIESGDGPITLRLNTIPAPDGEEIVIHVQRSTKALTLNELGMTNDLVDKVEQIIQQRSGLVVLSGPAGSGKTTTMYSLLNALASEDRKTVTAEDPIELRIPFVSHAAVTRQASFATLGRAFMHQDADVIFIGEVTTADSAETVVQLAQSGRLVFTTVHARDSVGVISRFEELGVAPNVLASTLTGSLAQRLVPRLCPGCRVETKLNEQALAQTRTLLEAKPGALFYKAGPGCPQCNGGIAGRIPIFEFLWMDSAITELVGRSAPRQEIVKMMQRKGMLSLAQVALLRVYNGVADYQSVKQYFAGLDAAPVSGPDLAPVSAPEAPPPPLPSMPSDTATFVLVASTTDPPLPLASDLLRPQPPRPPQPPPPPPVSTQVIPVGRRKTG